MEVIISSHRRIAGVRSLVRLAHRPLTASSAHTQRTLDAHSMKYSVGSARTRSTATPEALRAFAPAHHSRHARGYMRWDAVFLCFDTTDKISLYTILSWVRQVSRT